MEFPRRDDQWPLWELRGEAPREQLRPRAGAVAAGPVRRNNPNFCSYSLDNQQTPISAELVCLETAKPNALASTLSLMSTIARLYGFTMSRKGWWSTVKHTTVLHSLDRALFSLIANAGILFRCFKDSGAQSSEQTSKIGAAFRLWQALAPLLARE